MLADKMLEINESICLEISEETAIELPIIVSSSFQLAKTLVASFALASWIFKASKDLKSQIRRRPLNLRLFGLVQSAG